MVKTVDGKRLINASDFLDMVGEKRQGKNGPANTLIAIKKHGLKVVHQEAYGRGVAFYVDEDEAKSVAERFLSLRKNGAQDDCNQPLVDFSNTLTNVYERQELLNSFMSGLVIKFKEVDAKVDKIIKYLDI
jgi:ABC-type ATPase with predicted acetyltransferase domain